MNSVRVRALLNGTTDNNLMFSLRPYYVSLIKKQTEGCLPCEVNCTILYIHLAAGGRLERKHINESTSVYLTTFLVTTF